jgi:hypothetical protein
MPTALVIDDAVPGPSRLMQIQTRLEDMDSEVTSIAAPEVTVVNIPDSTTNPAPGPPRSANDLQSIEALAQNILEMQNLCRYVIWSVRASPILRI